MLKRKTVLHTHFHRSVKSAGELELKQADNYGFKAEEETMTSFELSYTDSQLDDFTFNVSAFLQELEVLSFGLGENRPVGTFSVWGTEFEVTYQKSDHLLTLSHSFTKLIEIADADGNQ